MTRLLLLPATVLLLTACGGGGSADEDAAAAAKAAYVQQASAVCDRAVQERDALPAPTGAADFAPYVRSLAGIAERAEADLRALTPPPADQEALRTKLLDPLGVGVDQGLEFAGKVEAAAGDPARLTALLGEAPTAAGIDLDYLRAYGLNACVAAIATTG